MSKSHEWSFPQYDVLSYWIDFWNLGTTGLSGVVITDTLPAETRYSGSWQPGFPGVSLVDEQPGRLIWQIANLNPGETGWIAFEALLERLFRQIDRRLSFGAKFGINEADFMHGLLQHFQEKKLEK